MSAPVVASSLGRNRACRHCGSPAWRNPCWSKARHTRPCERERLREIEAQDHAAYLAREQKRRDDHAAYVDWLKRHKTRSYRLDTAFIVFCFAAVAIAAYLNVSHWTLSLP